MALNPVSGNMYQFVTHTWNPVKGICPHQCSYCYMSKGKFKGKLKPPRLVGSEFKEDLGSGNYIFVGSSCDLFAADIPDEWIAKTFEYCHDYDNTYFFQTKNPGRIIEDTLPENSVICTTIESDKWYPDIMGNSPSIEDRVEAMGFFSVPKQVTIEPILEFSPSELEEIICNCWPEQVNIGADSQDCGLPEPSWWKVKDLIKELEKFTKVHLKPNLKRLEEKATKPRVYKYPRMAKPIK